MPNTRSSKTHWREFLPVLLLVGAVGFIFYTAQLFSNRLTSFDPRNQAAGISNADAFVKTNGTQFTLNGQPFKFVGFNLFDAANTYFPDQNKQGYSCPRDNGWWSDIYTEADLNQAMATMRQQSGASVLRFWAFQRYTNGGTDWSGIDKVLRVAKANGFKVIPVLDDGAGFCTYPEPAGFAKWKWNNDTWYTTGYKQIMGAYPLTYPQYVKAIVTRYKDDPTIMAWMMMNEADTSARVNGQSALVGFANDIGSLIKGIDQNHLVTVGTQSNGASGASGPDFAAVYGSPYVDFGEIHDWGYWGSDTDPLPGSPDGVHLPDLNSPDCQKTYQAKMACSMAFAKQLNKPIIIGEAGIAARTDQERATRATELDNKMKAFFNAGGAGYLVWQWNKVIDTEAYDVQATTNDPLLAKMMKYAQVQPLPLTSPSSTASPVPTHSPVPSVSPLPPKTLPTPKPNPTPIPSPSLLPRPTPTPSPILPIPWPSPVVSPKPSPKSTPVPSPSLRPSPNPSPVSSPNPPVVQTSNVLEAESMQVPTNDGRPYFDSLASQGIALLLSQNTTAVGQVRGPVQSLTVRAKADLCLGYPHINVKIDGNYALDTNITTNTFQDYRSNNLAYMNLGTGLHSIEVIYGNDFWIYFCDRNVRIDTITLNAN